MVGGLGGAVLFEMNSPAFHMLHQGHQRRSLINPPPPHPPQLAELHWTCLASPSLPPNRAAAVWSRFYGWVQR
jgi:hypothetical protein